MLVRLLDKDIRANWDLIKHTIKGSVPVVYFDEVAEEDVYTLIFDQLIEGRMQAWAFYKEERIKALIITQIRVGTLVGTLELLIFSIYGVHVIGEDDWIEGYNQLKEFAISQGCGQITAYTDEQSVAKRAKGLGGKIRYFLLMEV